MNELSMQRYSANIDIARRAIAKATEGKRGVAGIIACPICNSQLRYRIASSNGHIHAACESGNCVSWME